MLVRGSRDLYYLPPLCKHTQSQRAWRGLNNPPPPPPTWKLRKILVEIYDYKSQDFGKIITIKIGISVKLCLSKFRFWPQSSKTLLHCEFIKPQSPWKILVTGLFWFLSESPHPCEVWYNLVGNIETWKNYRQTNMMVTKLNDGKRLHVLWLIYWLLVITSIDKYFMDIYDQYKYIQYINTIQI